MDQFTYEESGELAAMWLADLVPIELVQAPT
jgi:hypothetical protein